MAKSITPRLGLQRWTTDADAWHRMEVDGSFEALEVRAAGFTAGTTVGRPAASADRERFFYYDYEKDILSVCVDVVGDGLGWAWVDVAAGTNFVPTSGGTFTGSIAVDRGTAYSEINAIRTGPDGAVRRGVLTNGASGSAATDYSYPIIGAIGPDGWFGRLDFLPGGMARFGSTTDPAASNPQLGLNNGAEAKPSLSFTGYPSDGFFHRGAPNEIAVALGGLNKYLFEAASFRTIVPYDGQLDLGILGARWRDLYLSGAVRVPAGAVGFHSAQTTNPAGTNIGEWTPFVRLKITTQYHRSLLKFRALSGNPGNDNVTGAAEGVVRLKQQNVMGGNPHISLDIVSHNAALKPDDFYATVTQNDAAATVLEVYVRTRYGHQPVYFFYDSHEANVPEWLSNQAFVVTPPAPVTADNFQYGHDWRKFVSFQETVYLFPSSFGSMASGTYQLDPSRGTVQYAPVGETTTFEFPSTFVSGDSMSIGVKQAFASITWPTNIYWVGGAPGALENNKTSWFSFWCMNDGMGNVYYGSYLGAA